MNDIERDQWGRPLIVTPQGRQEAYTRISTVASTLDDQYDLVNWKVRNAATGFLQHPDLFERFTSAAKAADANQAVEEAIDAAGGNLKREWGSAVHDAIHAMHTLGAAPPEFLGDDIAAYRSAVEGVEFLEHEAFGVIHSMALAGSWDAKGRCPDGRVRVFDIKTGRYKAQSCRIQLAAYALAENYPGGQTIPVEQDYGVVISLPGNGKCQLFKVDLRRGLDELRFALQLREYRKYSKLERSETLTWPKQEGWLHELIASASTREELRALWAMHRAAWGDEETGLANARLLVIGGEAA